jgi:hypothetical protein
MLPVWEKKNYAGSEISLPTLIEEKEPLWYWVPLKSSTNKKEKKRNRWGSGELQA